MWALLAVALVALALYALRRAEAGRPGAPASTPVAEPERAPAPAPTPRPADVAHRARELFAAGRAADALSLLYRAALAHLTRARRTVAVE